jgi:2'-5' RNA ligase
MNEEIKRVFFGLNTQAPWPERFPRGRVLEEQSRHMTLAFLGEIEYFRLKDVLSEIPRPLFKVGLTGIFDSCLFLPPKHPHVVSWHVDWLEKEDSLLSYRNELVDWLKKVDLPPKNEDREFLPHVTLSRQPFDVEGWNKAFFKCPLIAFEIHLYESLGNSRYQSLWSHSLIPPFMEFEHTADIAFAIYGENLEQLFIHAQMALAFRFPPMIPFLKRDEQISNLDDLVIALNDIVSQTDAQAEESAPFKAVSFHGEIQKDLNGVLKWEMIVDV